MDKKLEPYMNDVKINAIKVKGKFLPLGPLALLRWFSQGPKFTLLGKLVAFKIWKQYALAMAELEPVKAAAWFTVQLPPSKRQKMEECKEEVKDEVKEEVKAEVKEEVLTQ